MFPAKFGYFAAHSVEEALALLTQYGDDARVLAGGHSLIPAMKLRLATPKYLIDLGTVPGLRGVRVDGDSLAIGALTVHADVASSELVRQRVPGLAEAASLIGDVQIRNRGTIGGYPALHESLTGIIRLANSANVWRFRMCRRLSVENILLERLAQHLEHVAAKRRQLIPKDHAMVGQRHFAWRRHLAPFDQAHIRDGVVRGPTALLRLA